MQQSVRKSIKITSYTLIVYGLLVATHLGEFWPFSIYPMFSQAGHPWKRAIVQDVSDIPSDQLWEIAYQDQLPGQTIALDKLNVNTNDIANYLSKTKTWTPQKVNGVKQLVKKELEHKKLMVYQARGSLIENDSVLVEFVPYIYLTADTSILNKELRIK